MPIIKKVLLFIAVALIVLQIITSITGFDFGMSFWSYNVYSNNSDTRESLVVHGGQSGQGINLYYDGMGLDIPHMINVPMKLPDIDFEIRVIVNVPGLKVISIDYKAYAESVKTPNKTYNNIGESVYDYTGDTTGEVKIKGNSIYYFTGNITRARAIRRIIEETERNVTEKILGN